MTDTQHDHRQAIQATKQVVVRLRSRFIFRSNMCLLPTVLRCVSHSAGVWSFHAVERSREKRELLSLRVVESGGEMCGLSSLQPVGRGSLSLGSLVSRSFMGITRRFGFVLRHSILCRVAG